MKKLWILETKVTKNTLKETLNISKQLSEDLKKKKISLEPDYFYNLWSEKLKNSEEIWIPIISYANYFRFTASCKTYLKDLDNKTCLSLKESLGEIEWSSGTRQLFKNAHDSVRLSHRVVTSEIEDEEENYFIYKEPTINTGVYSYIWNSKNGEFKGSKR